MEEGYSWGAREEVDNRGECTGLRVGGLLFLPEWSVTLYLICGSLYPAEKFVPGKTLGILITCITLDLWDFPLPPQLGLRTSPDCIWAA